MVDSDNSTVIVHVTGLWYEYKAILHAALHPDGYASLNTSEVSDTYIRTSIPGDIREILIEMEEQNLIRLWRINDDRVLISIKPAGIKMYEERYVEDRWYTESNKRLVQDAKQRLAARKF